MSDFDLETATYDELEQMKDQIDTMMQNIEEHAGTPSLVELAEAQARDIIAHAERQAEERVIQAKRESEARIHAMEARLKEMEEQDSEVTVTMTLRATKGKREQMKARAAQRGMSLQAAYDRGADLFLAEEF